MQNCLASSNSSSCFFEAGLAFADVAGGVQVAKSLPVIVDNLISGKKYSTPIKLGDQLTSKTGKNGSGADEPQFLEPEREIRLLRNYMENP
ncbi:hypothetical protein MUP32_04840 [Candidatus Microgenomates bacterium]|nr:hypothetical protein [Candidatus Microgenomates bacterium]